MAVKWHLVEVEASGSSHICYTEDYDHGILVLDYEGKDALVLQQPYFNVGGGWTTSIYLAPWAHAFLKEDYRMAIKDGVWRFWFQRPRDAIIFRLRFMDGVK